MNTKIIVILICYLVMAVLFDFKMIEHSKKINNAERKNELLCETIRKQATIIIDSFECEHHDEPCPYRRYYPIGVGEYCDVCIFKMRGSGSGRAENCAKNCPQRFR